MSEIESLIQRLKDELGYMDLMTGEDLEARKTVVLSCHLEAFKVQLRPLLDGIRGQKDGNGQSQGTNDRDEGRSAPGR